MKTKLAVLVLCGLMAAGCSDRKTLIGYRFEPGERHEYRWVVSATRRLQSPTEDSVKKVRMQIEVDERIDHSGRAGTRLVELRLSPVLVEEDGVALALPPSSRVQFEVGKGGEVIRMIAGEGASGAETELSTLAGEIRPPLSTAPVQIGQSWKAPLKVRGPSSTIDLSGRGSLEGFDFADRRRLAVVKIVRKGAISGRQEQEGATITLKGRTRTLGEAGVDIDRGALVFSTQRSASSFDLISSGKVSGKLSVRLTSRLMLRR